VQIANGGVVLATFSNGAQLQIGQLAVGGAQNPESLVDIGNNEYRAGATTVALPAAVPQTGGEGQIIGESLESSNVDIATEFTNLISFQRGYQANSRVITTQNTMTQDLLNLIQ
jgi:flagellar hook protein FlgE